MCGKARDEECVVVAIPALSVTLLDSGFEFLEKLQLRDYLVAARVCARSLVQA